ncbi:methylated-DNA--[protein]-cysteine S-methyltransferase [Solihabitans fulvus]|uniref:methylated-DNA--[protein]-cysteine S-methyltransferase n=1 Tax=Solihabitans fulvus TaxID=1892852 RepID=A0A5B2X527_9PSEU|nr:methylated-DNA--[protein]-cysteine S-methyltransferase [Solihabitans fulvus]KAA2258152.1 methylated-DNA--[protein]-cysteine S-methyltransferase [Solihabitans fulvus]
MDPGASAGAGTPGLVVVATHETPVGTLSLAVTEVGLATCCFLPPEAVAARFVGDVRDEEAAAGTRQASLLALARTELDAYFAGTLQGFTVPVDLRLASAFDRSVLLALDVVGFGSTTTYGTLAKKLDLPPTAARAVGGSMAGNPVLIVVPCHRVVGSTGALVGYAGGLEVKRALLDLETDTEGMLF